METNKVPTTEDLVRQLFELHDREVHAIFERMLTPLTDGVVTEEAEYTSD